jgi:hypothetical protein
VRFRSRTEARWAIYLTALGVRWVHEPEGYALPARNYLPDFWLPDLGTFLEIKGTEPPWEAYALCAELSNATGKRVVLFPHEPRAGHACDGTPFWDGGGDGGGYAFCECPVCHRVGIEFGGRGGRICGNGCCADDRLVTSDAERFVEAARRANGHRFWEPGRGHR